VRATKQSSTRVGAGCSGAYRYSTERSGTDVADTRALIWELYWETDARIIPPPWMWRIAGPDGAPLVNQVISRLWSSGVLCGRLLEDVSWVWCLFVKEGEDGAIEFAACVDVVDCSRSHLCLCFHARPESDLDFGFEFVGHSGWLDLLAEGCDSFHLGL
jgi:hypothetical protein